jgi:glycosyltransferase involved in cell wall biosynthesis
MAEAGETLATALARRAEGDWRGAAAAYAAHLAHAPQDWAAWIQHGHCVKEAGDAEAALASYRRAELGLPDDADLQVQIGHALKLRGDLPGAREAHARALEIEPTNEAAWSELTGLLATMPMQEPAGLALVGDLRVVFDVSDLMSWFGSARAPSGIQRIQMEVAGAALARDAGLAEARLAVFRPRAGTWRELPREAFRRLCGLARAGADALDPAWTTTRAQAEAMLEAAPDLAFAEGAWLVNLGSSWWLPDYHLAVRAARARHGLRYAALVHDTGPVTIPEHSEPAVTARFARWFAALGVQADLLLAVSEATRGDMLRLAETHLPGLPFAPVAVLRPDAALPAPPAPPPGDPHPRMPAAGSYVLFVGTIESRKDHLFVLNAWLALLRLHGERVPMLVLAGRAGFNAGPALALLRRAPSLQGRVPWLDDVADGALAALYRGALFTICHSQHEGWGLPVTEALAAGKAVVAPAHSGLLESGQGLALHHAPGSEPEFLALIEKLLFEPGFREAAEARVAAGLRLRSWRAVSEELVALLDAAPPAPPRPAAPPLGIVHRLAAIEAAVPDPSMAWAELLRAGTGWHAPEGWGCRTRPGRALLRLPLPEGAGPIRLHLALRGAETARRVALRAGRGPRQVIEVAPGARPVAVLELEARGPVAEVTIDATAPAEETAPETGIGVAAVMACAPEDVAARLGFLERLRFVWPERA